MRSLFVRVLLWFMLAATASGAVVVLVNQWSAQPNLLNFFVGGLLSAHLKQARDAYERGGEEGLRRFIASFERGFAGGLRVTDGSGRDLLTGEDVTPTVAAQRRLSLSTFALVNRTPTLTRVTSDGRYRIYLPLGRAGVGRGVLRPELALVFLAVLGLCWVLARHLSQPVLQLQQVVERFGHGETTARAGSRRSDELGRLARSFDGMADRIEELVQGQRRLLLDISHELRSPLARLTIAVDLLQADPRDGASLAQIELEVDRLNQLIGEILQASRPDTGETKRRFTLVRLDRLLREVVAACRIEATDGRVLDVFECAECLVSGDTELLRRALENVLRNALRHAPPESVIDICLVPSVHDVRLTVRDRGPGVPDNVLPHLFTPFYRFEADRGRNTGGVGLGLAIARRAVEVHGGQIAARNARPGLEVEIRVAVPS
jgi:signal transduction histidine kinase